MGARDRRSWERPGCKQGDAEDGQLAEMRMQVARQRRAVFRKAERKAAGGVAIPAEGGSALDGKVQHKMESHLGGDLSGVRVHLGSESAEAANQLGARAFTEGQDLHFNAGQFAPGSKEGDRLLAHELTHVVQGQKSGIHRKGEDEKKDAASDEAEGMEVSQPEDAAEVEADKLGDEVAEKEHGPEAKGEKQDDEKISAKLAGTARKIFLAPDAAPGPPKASSEDEQWCRNLLTLVPSLDVTAEGTMDSLKSIGSRFSKCQADCQELPIYGQLGQAIDAKLSEVRTAVSQDIQTLIGFVQALPPRPPAAAAGGELTGAPADRGPGTAPPASAQGVAGAPQVVPGEATGGLVPALPRDMTPGQLQTLTDQREAWLAANPQRIDPNAGAIPGIRIWGQNTAPGADGQLKAGSEGHVMGTNTLTGVHSSFTGAETDMKARNANAASAGIPKGNLPGQFTPPFPGATPKQGQVLSGGNRSLGGDKYLGKPMDFDFTLSQQFLQEKNPEAMPKFDESVGAAKGRDLALADQGAPPSQEGVASGEFRLGTTPPAEQEARKTGVQATDEGGRPQEVPTTQAQNCGTDLMKRLLRLEILDTTDLAMLHADPDGNFLPNCDLTPQALADHLRWKQAEWEADVANPAKGENS